MRRGRAKHDRILSLLITNKSSAGMLRPYLKCTSLQREPLYPSSVTLRELFRFPNPQAFSEKAVYDFFLLE